MKQFYFLTFIFIFSLGYSQNPGDIVITEIMQNPAAVTDANGEYFEIHNATNDDIDIDGWTISDDGSDSHVITNGGPLIVPAEGYLVLGRNADIVTNGGYTVDYEYSGFTLANSADEVILTTEFDEEIDRVNYDGGPNFPDPTGASMNLSLPNLNATDNDNGENWCESTKVYGDGDFGSPGGVNDDCGALGIDDNLAQTFSIYPNPTSIGYVSIKGASGGVINVAVFDVLGKQVLKQTITGRLDVSNLNVGIYVLRLVQNDNITTKKLVIQ